MRRIFLCILLDVLSSSSALAGDESSLSREKALAIAKKTAKARGIHLERYKLEAFPRELSKDGKEWTFFFQCTPQPIPPGCHFWVSVDRSTGAATYLPGE